MATLRHYFETDFSQLLKCSQPTHLINGATDIEVAVNLHYDFDANAKFLSCFVPKCECPATACAALLRTVDQMLAIGNSIEVQFGRFGERVMGYQSLRFCGRCFFYNDSIIPEIDLEQLRCEAEANGLFIQFRGPQYAESRASLETPVAFISHDFRDKEKIARPIAIELSKLMCPVWYDEFSLKVGDPLRESIEKGLKECKKCILVLTKTFLANQGWTKAEFNTVFTRERVEGKNNLVLPIWCGISKNDLYEYSPTLVDRLGIAWDRGLNDVVREIHRALN